MCRHLSSDVIEHLFDSKSLSGQKSAPIDDCAIKDPCGD